MDENGVKLVCFEYWGAKFAFNMDYLVEIAQVAAADITPCFSPNPLLRGQWNYRRRTVDFIDLRDFFGLEQRGEDVAGNGRLPIETDGETLAQETTQKNPLKSILVVKIREQLFGLLTDAVLRVVPLGVFYEYPGMISTLPKKYFAGITIIQAEVVLILAIEEFIHD
jgi:chemotaxis signal transduction protein